MPFVTPTLNDLVRVAENGLFTSFGIDGGSVLRKSVIKVIARVFAGVCFLLVLLLRKMWKNVFISSCDVETLDDFGTDFDLPNKPEGFAKGVVIVKKTTASNVTLQQGTVLSYESGIEFEIDAGYTLSGAANSEFPVKVIAVQSGPDSNVSASAVLEFRDGTPEGLSDDVVVDSEGLSGGVKIEVLVNGNTEFWGESVEEYRERLLNYRRYQPAGGCGTDYKAWAERFPAVTKCIVEQNYPVVNAVTCVLAYYGQGQDSIAVNSTNVNEVKDYIQSDVRRPITADVRVVSCVPKSIDFSIRISPDNTNVRSSVQSALSEALKAYVPGESVDADDLTVALRGSSVADSVAVTLVGGGNAVTLSKSGHELPVIGTITWINADA